ncbi:unnamed protein product [Malus baccata var. baccata]
MVQLLGTIRPSPSLSYFATYKRQLSLYSPPTKAPANGFSPFRRVFNSYLQSNSETTAAGSPCEDSEIIFIGTGTSEGIPRVSCLTNPLKTCAVCLKAVEPGNKNKRLNTSILVRYPRPSGNYNILIDAGKFFYHSALQWFTAYGIRTIDAVIITHSHADAIGGLDDLRDWTNNVQPSIPIYVAQRDFEVMKKTHYYLVDTSAVLAGAAVSELQFNIIREDPFVVQDLKFTPLPVWHGQGYRSLGFRFGNVCYISDVSDIPEETYPLLKDCELLILVPSPHSNKRAPTHLFISVLFLSQTPDISFLLTGLICRIICSGCFTARSVFFNAFRTPKGFGGSTENPTEKDFVHWYDASDGS